MSLLHNNNSIFVIVYSSRSIGLTYIKKLKFFLFKNITLKNKTDCTKCNKNFINSVCY